jgi:hypothetical protein
LCVLKRLFVFPSCKGDGLTVELDKYDGLEYYACFKLGAAAPVAAGRNNWDTAGYCELFHFVNTTTTTTTTATSTSTVKRAVLRVPANLRGVGSRAGAVAAESVVVDSVHSNEHARRSVTAAGARGVAVQNVRAGTYYITIAAINAIASNTTLSLKLSGMACPGAGQYGPACAALAPVSEGVSFPFNGVAANGSAAARFGDSKLINDTTAALTIAAQVDTADGSVDVLARWGGVPTADLHDAKLVVGDKGVHTAQVVAPRAANWYFAVLNNNNKTAVNANITVTLTQCGAGLFGPHVQHHRRRPRQARPGRRPRPGGRQRRVLLQVQRQRHRGAVPRAARRRPSTPTRSPSPPRSPSIPTPPSTPPRPRSTRAAARCRPPPTLTLSTAPSPRAPTTRTR